MTMYLLAISSTQVQQIVQPIIDVLNAAVVPLMGLVAAVGAIWCIVLGVRYAKAEDPQEHEKAKKALINAIIGYVLIFLLLVMLHVGADLLQTYYEGEIAG